jgi:hypothetical protein
VNDLYTADLAEELADALGASLIVNSAVDRNHLDLNRISQVAARAGWFLELIEALVDAILARHDRAELLFVHGWNVIQPKCDIGIGNALRDAASAPDRPELLTVSCAYAADRLARLQRRCAAVGITTTFGVRYPARHPNNLLQLFRHTPDRSIQPSKLCGWAAAGRLEAVQLELGVPVRWPGAPRRAFLQAAAEVFGGAAQATHREPAAAFAPGGPRGEAVHSAALQAYDARAGIALTARVDRAGAHSAGRLLLFLGRERMTLFIGEDPHDAAPSRQGPHFTPTPDGFQLRFAGAALASDHGALYFDLEQGFAASQLCSIAVDVEFRRGLSADYGTVAGWVEVDGERHGIDACAFTRPGVLQGSIGGWSSQLALSAAFGAERALRVRYEFPGRGAVRELTPAGEVEHAATPLTICLDGDRYTPARIVVGERCHLVCEPVSRMTITRPLPPHRQARVTFGAARFTCGGEQGFGFYEYARALT